MAKKPVIIPLSFWRGNSESFEFRFKDVSGNPFDLTGYDVTLSINHDAGTVKKKLSTGSIVCADVTLGVISTEVTPTETRAMIMQRRPGSWELEISTNDGYQRTLLAGPVTADGGLNDD